MAVRHGQGRMYLVLGRLLPHSTEAVQGRREVVLVAEWGRMEVGHRIYVYQTSGMGIIGPLYMRSIL